MSQLSLGVAPAAPDHAAPGRETLDRYYTPPKLAERCVEVLDAEVRLRGLSVLEPSVGGGAFARTLRARGALVSGLDLDRDAEGARWCEGFFVADFLGSTPNVHGIIGNPPYSAAEEHIAHALDQTGRHVAFLLRGSILGGRGRHARLWSLYPPRVVWLVVGRPSYTADGASDSVDAAFVWWDLAHRAPTQLRWLTW